MLILASLPLQSKTYPNLSELKKMRQAIECGQYAFRLHLVVGFFLVSAFYGNQCFASNVPLKNVTVTTESSGTQIKVNFSVNDPYRGVVSGTSGFHDVGQSYVQDGIVVWVYAFRNPDLSLSYRTNFSVYDPIQGTWKNGTSDSVGYGWSSYTTSYAASTSGRVVTV